MAVASPWSRMSTTNAGANRFFLEPLEFGKCSIAQLEGELPEMPFELPVEQYLSETLAGMIGAPQPGKEDAAEVSPNWRRLKKVLAAPPALEVCTALTWLAVGVIFGLVDDDGAERLREGVPKAWMLLTSSLSGKGRDWLLDVLPAAFVQTIYRLMVDGFAPDYGLLTKSWAAVLEKIGMIVQHEIVGFQVTPQTLRELRRRLFRDNILERPYLSLFAARKAKARQEQLEGHSAEQNGPLAFGNVKGHALEETQMEHVLHLRRRAAAAEKRKGANAMPPLCPAELSADRHMHAEAHGEELYLRHLELIDPEAAAAEREVALVAQSEDESSSVCGEASPMSLGTATPQGGGSPQRRSASARHSRMGRKGTVRVDTAAEKRRQEEKLEKQMLAPLPEAYLRRAVRTGGVSPILEKLAPGVRARGESTTVRMRAPSEQFLPQIAETSPGGSPAGRTAGGASHMSPTASIGGAGTLSGRSPKLPKIADVDGEVPFRGKRAAIQKRLEQELDAFKKQSFEQYKKDFDVVTGRKRTRLDGERLQHEETAVLQRHEALIGSRSAPALRLLGPRNAAEAETRGGRQSAEPSAGRAAGTALAADGLGGPRLHFRHWNELTRVEISI